MSLNLRKLEQYISSNNYILHRIYILNKKPKYLHVQSLKDSEQLFISIPSKIHFTFDPSFDSKLYILHPIKDINQLNTESPLICSSLLNELYSPKEQNIQINENDLKSTYKISKELG